MPPIECKLGYAETAVGNETYLFTKDKHGRFVAEVPNLKHVQILLSRPEIYAEVRDDALNAPLTTLVDDDEIELLSDEDFDEHPATEEEERARMAAEAEAARFNSLLGSDILPSTVAITPDLSVALGEVVARAHKDSGLTVEAWNTLPMLEREALLVKAIEAMQTEANPPDVPPTTHAEALPPADDLALLHGIGPTSATKLRNAGVLYIAQLAALSPEGMAALDAELNLNGLSHRGNWVQAAKDYIDANPRQ